MEKKNLVCCAFLCSLFLNAIHAKKCEENCVVKHCQQILQQGKCDDDKMCFAACKKQLNTTEMAFCLLPDKQACNCDEGPISDCSEKIKLEGCNNAMCAGACMDKVKGAVSGTCLPGNHACDCFIPC
ncbi:hypothetical protein RHGRI_025234 [Rhododendron griersonianum]|uniref:Defensin-like protein n=1 Tax=Rhododendron griersonianum TaxID=479676 RepID=A0AAV6JD57_9ERIC|nr:hypothetical protein RHGRI_025234 [Rhododendron griersonianum]